jgi:hypothetical protein
LTDLTPLAPRGGDGLKEFEDRYIDPGLQRLAEELDAHIAEIFK